LAHRDHLRFVSSLPHSTKQAQPAIDGSITREGWTSLLADIGALLVPGCPARTARLLAANDWLRLRGTAADAQMPMLAFLDAINELACELSSGCRGSLP